ncbi:hypothetical protein D0T25_20330 [Duganella sp. BJB488]|uniref:hypothetical protein n=1 Tax=unclassified Duganella TaxID=2636909 RepID=UPI000E34AF4F|nr:MULTISPECIES: hypothetical protein [unclassified Duganella]RFP15457.1 hypothetical protein D0T26_21135 [Duganella sp. BJB489]RFP20014.1 hypothetical protein D0T25_20330 [Duganella sp. BJB488]RFP38402.1 hypothetical protein D0T24_02085 [Duganella sp. BJB480]
MPFTKRASLFIFAALLLGCSRSPQPPQEAPASKTTASKQAASKEITESQALDLLLAGLKRRKVADLDCLEFMAETDDPAVSKAEQWEFAAHEIHDKRCGGDPGVSPVRDRYQISSAGKVKVYDAAEGEFKKF